MFKKASEYVMHNLTKQFTLQIQDLLDLLTLPVLDLSASEHIISR